MKLFMTLIIRDNVLYNVIMYSYPKGCEGVILFGTKRT